MLFYQYFIIYNIKMYLFIINNSKISNEIKYEFLSNLIDLVN